MLDAARVNGSGSAWRSADIRVRAVLAAALVALALPSGVGAQASPSPQAAGTTVINEPGQEPRHAMAYRPREGWAADFELITRITPRVIVDDQEPPPSPGAMIQLPIRFELVQASATSNVVMGTVGTPRVVPADGVTPAMAKAVQDQVAGAAGGRVVLELTGRGELVRSSVLNADALPAGGRELLNNAVSMLSASLVPLPSEPIGRGAKVRIDQPVKAEQLDLALTQALEFPALLPSGCQVRAKLSTVMAPVQEAGPDKPKSASIEGTVSIDMLTDRPLPVQVISRTTRSVLREVARDGRTQSLRTIMTIEVNLREVVVPPATVRNPGEPAPVKPAR